MTERALPPEGVGLMDLDQSPEVVKHYAAIGRVAEAWAYLEFCLDGLCGEVAGLDMYTASCLTSHIQGQRKLDALMSLILRHGDTKTHKDLELIAKKRFSGLAEQRNRVVHDPWLILSSNALRFEITARRKLVHEQRLVTTSEVSKLCANIKKLGDDIGTLVRASPIYQIPPNTPGPLP